MDKGINKEFVKLLEDPSVRFTVILGSGFHIVPAISIRYITQVRNQTRNAQLITRNS